MGTNELQEALKGYRVRLGTVSKLVGEIARLEKDRSGNLPQLKTRLTKLEALVESSSQSADIPTILRTWIPEYCRELTNTEASIKKRFGAELAQELAQQGLSLTGQYPELKAGLFTFEVDLDAYRVKIWYGPKQELLEQCKLSPGDIGARIGKVREQLGSRLEDTDFVRKLHFACSRAAPTATGARIPIISVLAELAYLLQSSRFRQDPRRENYRSYSRADFSYDLFRAREAVQTVIDGRYLGLIGAARQHTRRRQDFLWVPKNPDGEGDTYSHLHLKEGTL